MATEVNAHHAQTLAEQIILTSNGLLVKAIASRSANLPPHSASSHKPLALSRLSALPPPGLRRKRSFFLCSTPYYAISTRTRPTRWATAPRSATRSRPARSVPVVTVYDLPGRTIKTWTLSDSEGQITMNAGELASGLYLYDLQVGGRQVLERKMSVVKD